MTGTEVTHTQMTTTIKHRVSYKQEQGKEDSRIMSKRKYGQHDIASSPIYSNIELFNVNPVYIFYCQAYTGKDCHITCPICFILVSPLLFSDHERCIRHSRWAPQKGSRACHRHPWSSAHPFAAYARGWLTRKIGHSEMLKQRRESGRGAKTQLQAVGSLSAVDRAKDMDEVVYKEAEIE